MNPTRDPLNAVAHRDLRAPWPSLSRKPSRRAAFPWEEPGAGGFCGSGAGFWHFRGGGFPRFSLGQWVAQTPCEHKSACPSPLRLGEGPGLRPLISHQPSWDSPFFHFWQCFSARDPLFSDAGQEADDRECSKLSYLQRFHSLRSCCYTVIVVIIYKYYNLMG